MGSGVVLGISCDNRDAAAALVIDGSVVAAVEEERFSRRRHDPSLPASAVESCLRIAGVGAADIAEVAFYEKPLVAMHRFVVAHRRQGPRAFKSFASGIPDLVRLNLMVGYRIDRLLARLGAEEPPPISYLEHHVSHASAAYYPSPFPRAAVLTADGVGEWATASISRGHGSRLDVIEEMRYPDSIGLLCAVVTAYCGFAPNDGEHKLMALAAYGEPRYLDGIRELALLRADASLQLSPRRLNWFRSPEGSALQGCFEGSARKVGEPLTQRFADVAASVQLLVENALIAMVDRAKDVTGESDLCLAGGVGLNSVAVGRLRRESGLTGLWVQPAAGDSGSAVGAALALWHRHRGRGRDTHAGRDGMSGSFLGPAATGGEAAAWLSKVGVPFTQLTDEALFGFVAERLEQGAVVGWSRGRCEFGPRALGHRSILADPRSTSVRRRLNEEIKRREFFRPFAPAVLEEHAAGWFELDGPSEYMSSSVMVTAGRLTAVAREPDDLRERSDLPRSEIPACTHVDGSAQVQTVSADGNPDLHGLLTAFYLRTACPVLLNTSFNGPGEPIVTSPEDAYRCATAIGLDLLVVEDCVVDVGGSRDAAEFAP